MRLVILDDAAKAGEWAAKYVKKRIIEFKPGPDKYFVLGLPTGNHWQDDLCFRLASVSVSVLTDRRLLVTKLAVFCDEQSFTKDCR